MGVTVQEGFTLSSSFEKVVLPNERFVSVDLVNRQVDPTLLSIQMEVESISTAIETLQQDIEHLISLKNVIPICGRKSRSRSFDMNLFETDRDNLIRRFYELIGALNKELIRLRHGPRVTSPE